MSGFQLPQQNYFEVPKSALSYLQKLSGKATKVFMVMAFEMCENGRVVDNMLVCELVPEKICNITGMTPEDANSALNELGTSNLVVYFETLERFYFAFNELEARNG